MINTIFYFAKDLLTYRDTVREQGISSKTIVFIEDGRLILKGDKVYGGMNGSDVEGLIWSILETNERFSTLINLWITDAIAEVNIGAVWERFSDIEDRLGRAESSLTLVAGELDSFITAQTTRNNSYESAISMLQTKVTTNEGRIDSVITTLSSTIEDKINQIISSSSLVSTATLNEAMAALTAQFLNMTEPPARCYYDEWQNLPPATTTEYPYLWMRVLYKNAQGEITSTRYYRITSDDHRFDAAGTCVDAQFAASNTPLIANIHSKYRSGDVYMRYKGINEVFNSTLDENHPWVDIAFEGETDTNYAFNISKDAAIGYAQVVVDMQKNGDDYITLAELITELGNRTGSVYTTIQGIAGSVVSGLLAQVADSNGNVTAKSVIEAIANDDEAKVVLLAQFNSNPEYTGDNWTEGLIRSLAREEMDASINGATWAEFVQTTTATNNAMAGISSVSSELEAMNELIALVVDDDSNIKSYAIANAIANNSSAVTLLQTYFATTIEGNQLSDLVEQYLSASAGTATWAEYVQSLENTKSEVAGLISHTGEIDGLIQASLSQAPTNCVWDPWHDTPEGINVSMSTNPTTGVETNQFAWLRIQEKDTQGGITATKYYRIIDDVHQKYDSVGNCVNVQFSTNYPRSTNIHDGLSAYDSSTDVQIRYKFPNESFSGNDDPKHPWKKMKNESNVDDNYAFNMSPDAATGFAQFVMAMNLAVGSLDNSYEAINGLVSSAINSDGSLKSASVITAVTSNNGYLDSTIWIDADKIKIQGQTYTDYILAQASSGFHVNKVEITEGLINVSSAVDIWSPVIINTNTSPRTFQMASSTSSPNASKGIVEDTINIDGRTISNSPLKIVDAVSLGAFSSPYNLTDNEKGTLGIIFNGPSWSIGWNERTDSDGVLQISDIGESDGFKADQYVISTKRGYAHAPGGTQYIPAGIYCEGEVVSSAWLNDELTGEQSNESSRITPGLVETATVNASVKVMAPQVQLGSISTIEGGVSNNDSYVNITTDHMTFNTDSIDISGDLHVIDGSDDYLGATQVITIPINGGQSVTFTFVNGILVNYNNGQQTLNPGT